MHRGVLYVVPKCVCIVQACLHGKYNSKYNLQTYAPSLSSTIPFHIFSFILTARSRLAFNFLFSASNSATLSELVSATPADGEANIVLVGGRNDSKRLDPF